MKALAPQKHLWGFFFLLKKNLGILPNMPINIKNNLNPVDWGDASIYLIVDKGILPTLSKKIDALFPKNKILGISFLQGEKEKTLGSYTQILSNLAATANIDRNTQIIGIGGGAVLDVAGFVASTFMRGLPLHLIPTTLLGAIDAAIGGKNGINLPEGKNLVGTYYRPHSIVVYLPLFNTLPERELKAGFGEVIKYAILKKNSLFEDLETNNIPLETLIRKCSAIKVEIIEQDFKDEKGIRATLNLGHTFAHALETVFSFGPFLHGEAVSIGLNAAAQLSAKLNLCSPNLPERIRALCQKFSLPTTFPNNIDPALFVKVMKLDKKNNQGKITCILPVEIGKVVPRQIEDRVMLDFIKGLLWTKKQPSLSSIT